MNDLLSYLLRHIEGSPETKFYESDLTRISPSELISLKKQKYLVFDQYDFEKESYFDKQGNERYVRKINGKWVASSTDDPEISPIYLEDKDLNRYTFNIQPLLVEIKKKNNLAKNIDQITGRVSFIGEATVLQNIVGVFLALVSDDEQAEAELLGLRAKIGKVDKILVLCPSYIITSQDLLGRLAGHNTACLTFGEVFNGKDYVIDFSKMRSVNSAGQAAPKLTDKQTSDYTKYGYQCYDHLHIPGTAPMKRSNDLSVNSHTIKMPDAPLKLLMELVVELKKGKGGWLTKVVDVGKYQIFGHVRSPLQGSLLEKDAKKFIENNASKQYRISTHPDFVTYDRGNLLNHSDPTVQALAKKLPKKVTAKKSRIRKKVMKS